MISILIPTYNYSVYPLIDRLHHELNEGDYTYEILVRDDASTSTLPENSSIGKFENVHFSVSERNLGRVATRQWLAENARYDTLLFLDADMLPINDDFVHSFLKEINQDVVFGGIVYEVSPPTADKMLRWKYGRNRETVSVSDRKEQPYLSVNSGCFMIKRSLFLRTNQKLQFKKYGLDNYFKELLRIENSSVSHIENPAYHLGLETNEQFLKKALAAIDTTVYLEREKKLGTNVRPLQKSFIKLKRYGLTGLYSAFISAFKKKMESNFLSGNPNLFWFDLYRLHYYIQLKRN